MRSSKSEGINSSNYLFLQKELHEDELYLAASTSFAPIIKNIIENNSFNSICNYGSGFISINQEPAERTLADGKNTHLVPKPCSWWLPRIYQYFGIIRLDKHYFNSLGIWNFGPLKLFDS